MTFTVKIKEELLNIQYNLHNYHSSAQLETDISIVLHNQEKIWRILFTKNDNFKCRTIIKTFFDGMDFIHRPILKNIIVDWDSSLILVALRALFFLIEMLEKYECDIKNYLNGLRKLLF